MIKIFPKRRAHIYKEGVGIYDVPSILKYGRFPKTDERVNRPMNKS